MRRVPGRVANRAPAVRADVAGEIADRVDPGLAGGGRLSDSVAVGRTQKLDAADITPAVATVGPGHTPAHPDSAGSPEKRKNTAATPAGIAMCHLLAGPGRSGRPKYHRHRGDTPGIVDTGPIVNGSREMVSLMICGSQNVTP